MGCVRLVFAVLLLLLATGAAWSAPEGQVTWVAHVSLVPTWFGAWPA